eukprot:358132-Chlamydomonas_euryale.AAC.2
MSVAAFRRASPGELLTEDASAGGASWLGRKNAPVPRDGISSVSARRVSGFGAPSTSGFDPNVKVVFLVGGFLRAARGVLLPLTAD